MTGPYSPVDIIRSGLCIGCGSCVAQNKGQGALMKLDTYGHYKPVGNSSWLSNRSESFTRSCPFSPGAENEDQLAAKLFSAGSTYHAALGKYHGAYVGHVAEQDFRNAGSSGGLVTWVATELLSLGLIDGVAHVVAVDDPHGKGKFFGYQISRDEKAIRNGARSRYYPVELSGVIQQIREIPGRYAVVGIPCFIKAVQLLRGRDAVLQERIRFTLGLFCGHMKSASFVQSMAWQMKVPFSQVRKVEYRSKDDNRPAKAYNATLHLADGTSVNKDWWNLADGDWGAGFFMNPACNYCDDVMAETADIAFGDAWVEPYASDPRGTNVIVVRSMMVHQLVAAAIKDGRLQLERVNADFVEQTQAAGLRQRREGLAFRLSWKNTAPVRAVKRVKPAGDTLTPQRKLIYRLRYLIAVWSHRVFSFANLTGQHWVDRWWGVVTGAIYYGFAYHKGSFSEMKKRFSGWVRL